MSQRLPTIAPAIIADEWDSLVAQIEQVHSAAERIQIDVMDGQLVPSFSFPYNKTMLANQTLPHANDIHFEAHLMVQHPQEVGIRFIHAGARSIIAQIEGFRVGEASRVYNIWKEAGAVETGVSLMLDTPIEHVYPLIENGDVALVQVMSIARIGFQGEAFDSRALMRIQELKERYPNVTIAVDGGVSADNLETLLDAGATQFGIGSAIMRAENPSEALTQLQRSLDAYAQRFKHSRA